MRPVHVLPLVVVLSACGEKSLPLVSPYREMNLPVADGTVHESRPERVSVDHQGVDRAKKQADYLSALKAWGCKEEAPPKTDGPWTSWACNGNGQRVSVRFERSGKQADRVIVIVEAKAAK